MPQPEEYILKYQFRASLVRMITDVFRLLTWLGIAWLIGHYGYWSIRALAGQQTHADLLLKLYLLIRVPKVLATVLAYVWAGGSTAWAVTERKSKKKIIARNHRLISDAQKARDPGKGSSHITLKGDTSPEDL